MDAKASSPQSTTTNELGKLITQHTKTLRQLGWRGFIRSLQLPLDTHPHLRSIPHPANIYLHNLATHGVPAPSQSPPWSRQMLQQTLRRGAHMSAQCLYKEFLHDEFLDMVRKGYWSILPFDAVCHLPHLKLSPAGVVPQRERRPRPIMDYSFTAVNSNSLPISPTAAMQLGQAFTRFLHQIAYANPAFGPPRMLKLDLADGYYRVRLTPTAALELAVVLPGLTPQQNLVGIPLCLPMGWTHSPPYFCAFTETAADLANSALRNPTMHPWAGAYNPLEVTSQETFSLPSELDFHPDIVHPPTVDHKSPPIGAADIYIDDFLAIAQTPTQTQVLRTLLNAIGRVFRQDGHPDDRPDRKQTISTSKLLKGDGCWSTKKVILGWELDTYRGTLRLPDHKAARLRELLQTFGTLRRTSKRKWLQLLGELRYMSTAIKGASYLFSILQSTLTQQPGSKRLRLSPLVHRSLQDWQALAQQLTECPVPIASLVPRAPHYVGAVDASGTGIGGFWLPSNFGSPHARPIVFRHAFDDDTRSQLVSAKNRQGQLTNSDFELAALVLGSSIMARHTPLNHDALWCASDNTPAVAWCAKGSPTSTNINAYLLGWLAQLSREYRFNLTPISVPGHSNTLADFASRSFHLSDKDFLQEFNDRHPINPSWLHVHPTKEDVLALNCALSKRMSPWESTQNDKLQTPPSGTHGRTSAFPSMPTQHSTKQMTRLPCSSSSHIVTVGAKYLPAALLSRVRQWEMPFAPLGRRFPTWATRTPAYCLPVN